MKAISSLALTKCEAGKWVESLLHSCCGKKKATLCQRLLKWPDVITFCKRVLCLLNYTHYLWIAVTSQGRGGKMKRWVCRCWPVTLPQARVCFFRLTFRAGCSWNLRVNLYTHWNTVSQLFTIDFMWICKCSDLQANPVMEHAGAVNQCAKRHHGNGFRFHLTGPSVRLDLIALWEEIWQCREEGNQEIEWLWCASGFQNLLATAGNVVLKMYV